MKNGRCPLGDACEHLVSCDSRVCHRSKSKPESFALPQLRYCHLPHVFAGAKLDKQQRETFKSMTDQQRLALLLPHLKRKAASKGLLAKAGKLIQLLEAEFDYTTPKPSVDRRMESVIERMSLAHMVKASMNRVPECVSNALQELRHQFPPPEVVVTEQRLLINL